MTETSIQHGRGIRSVRSSSRGNSARTDSETRLSDGDLLSRLEKARGTERAVQREIVLYLAEVERRRLYLPRGYGSLFEFCTDYLQYSRSSAARRISAARCIARFPRMAALFRREEIDLTVLAAIAGVVTKENCTETAAWLRGKSLREVEAYARQRQPSMALRDQVRPIYVRRIERGIAAHTEAAPAAAGADAPSGTAHPAARAANRDSRDDIKCKASFTFTPSAGTKMAQLADNKPLENQEVHGDDGGGASEAAHEQGTAPAASVGTAPAERVVVERKYKIQFAVDPEFMEKMRKIKSLLSTKYPKGMNFQALFDILMTEYLERHSPEKRMQKRKQRRENKRKRDSEKNKGARNGKSNEFNKDTWSGNCGAVNGAVKKKTENKSPGNAKKKSSNARTRHIPQAVKDEVFVRDGGRCTFIGNNGKRCEETWNLEVDHIVPYAKGGDNSPENLRLLCARHNILEAEREYGKKFMKRFQRKE